MSKIEIRNKLEIAKEENRNKPIIPKTEINLK